MCLQICINKFLKHPSMSSGRSNQNINLFDDLFVSDSSEELYSPSSELSSSENEEIHDVEEPINSNAEPSTGKKKGKGRSKIAEHEKTRKRKRNPSAWSRYVRQEARLKGNPYLSTSNTFVPGKILKPACYCKRNCGEKLSENSRLKIFQDFYNLDSNSQNQFIAQSLEEVNKKTERLRQNERPSKRKFTLFYFLYNEGCKVQVCRTMFLNTLDIKPGKTKILAAKKRESASGGICSNDNRGRHGHQIRVSINAIAIIEQHIRSFPSYISHYSRLHTDKKYLSQDLNIAKMYKLYKEDCISKNIQPQLESFYRKVFVENFNLSFHRPSNDTCAKCDKYKLQINNTSDFRERTVCEDNYNQHLTTAEEAYKEKKKDKTSSCNNETIAFLSFDLQKCLPTPLLQNNISFYKRSLWTYNLTIYSCVHRKKHAVCYIWDESLGGRGGQEISSCLRHYILSLPNDITEIHMFSDCCPGQTRNIYVAVMLSLLIEDYVKIGRKIIINHKFLEPGHTHLEADTVHAAIEKVKSKTTAKIELPRDWANLIRMVPRNPPIEVLEIEQKDLLNFEDTLKDKYIHRKINTNKEAVNWLQIKWMQYTTKFPTKVLYKNSFDLVVDFKVLDLSRTTRSNAYATRATTSFGAGGLLGKETILQPLHRSRIPLPEKKLKDLKDLMQYISETSRYFYNDLTGQPGSCDDEYLPDERIYEDDD